MTESRKDLRRNSISSDDTAITLVTDGKSLPILKTVFINGQEVFMPVGAGAEVKVSDTDLTQITLTLIPTSVEVITEQEMEQRLQ